MGELVSIIIPTYNSEKTLGICLDSIKNQTYKDIEIIIVDNFSSDRTAEIAKKFGVKIIFNNSERSVARNIGIKEARGKYVLLLDSDMVLTPKVIEECVKLIEKYYDIGGIVIPERSIGKSFWVKIRDFERSFYAGTPIESARFFRKDLVEKVSGYDEDIVFFEESTLPQKIEKLGYNVKARINSVILHCENDFSLWNWLKKKYYYGKTSYKYKSRYSFYASKQINPFYRCFIFLKNKKFYMKPTYLVGVLFLKFLEYISTGLGYVVGKLENRKSITNEQITKS